MSNTKIQINDNILNLVQLQEKMDDVVFNYLDTTHNWQRAFDELDVLLKQAISYYQQKVEEPNRNLPKGNVYWVLFMDVVSKLIFFRAVAKKNLLDLSNPSEKQLVLENLRLAANCLPNVQKGNYEFLQEIAQCYEGIELLEGKEGAFEQFYFSQNNPVEVCLKHFEDKKKEKEQEDGVTN